MEGEVEFLGDDLIDQIDWNQLFDGFPESANILDSPPEADSSASSWIDGIEKALMKDDDDIRVASDPAAEFCENFLADILVDSPAADVAAAAAAAASTDSDPNVSADDSAISGKDNLDLPEVDDAAADDPISKKRRRQMRNRDAAVRSRERKKTYVKDLEMKSKYLEGECRRLGRLLHCCYAENQALRFTLQMGNNAFAASATKQESAVLLLESLLLGSLLWWLGIMCLSSLQVKPNPEDEDQKMAPPQGAAPRESGAETCGRAVVPMFVKSRRRCKASWPKMKQLPGSWSFLYASALVF